jgi:hypothetical protein
MPKTGYSFCLIPAHRRAERRPGGVLESAGVAPLAISVQVVPGLEREGGQAAKFKLIKSLTRERASSPTEGAR